MQSTHIWIWMYAILIKSKIETLKWENRVKLFVAHKIVASWKVNTICIEYSFPFVELGAHENRYKTN